MEYSALFKKVFEALNLLRDYTWASLLKQYIQQAILSFPPRVQNMNPRPYPSSKPIGVVALAFDLCVLYYAAHVPYSSFSSKNTGKRVTASLIVKLVSYERRRRQSNVCTEHFLWQYIYFCMFRHTVSPLSPRDWNVVLLSHCWTRIATVHLFCPLLLLPLLQPGPLLLLQRLHCWRCCYCNKGPYNLYSHHCKVLTKVTKTRWVNDQKLALIINFLTHESLNPITFLHWKGWPPLLCAAKEGRNHLNQLRPPLSRLG